MSTSLIEQQPQSTALSTTTAAAQSRAIAEVQAAVLSAKKFPRDEGQAIAKILKTCERVAFADAAEYSYPRGNQTVSGPSIKVAQELQRAFGNMQSGVMELQRFDDYSLCSAWAVDLESNTRSEIAFTVDHYIDTRNGKKRVTDARDISGLILNFGNRIKRNCILSLIPEDIVDLVMERCRETLTKAAGEKKLEDRVAAMVRAFADMDVTEDMIAKKVGHSVKSINEKELSILRKAYNAIKQEAGTVEQFFPMTPKDPKSDKTPKQDVVEPAGDVVQE